MTRHLATEYPAWIESEFPRSRESQVYRQNVRREVQYPWLVGIHYLLQITP